MDFMKLGNYLIASEFIKFIKEINIKFGDND